MFAVLCILYKNDTQEAQNSTCWRHRKLTLVLPQKEGCVRVIKGRQINFESYLKTWLLMLLQSRCAARLVISARER